MSTRYRWVEARDLVVVELPFEGVDVDKLEQQYISLYHGGLERLALTVDESYEIVELVVDSIVKSGGRLDDLGMLNPDEPIVAATFRRGDGSTYEVRRAVRAYRRLAA